MHSPRVKLLPYWPSNDRVVFDIYPSIYGDFVLFVTVSGILGLHFLDRELDYYLHLIQKKAQHTPLHSPERVHVWKTRIASGVHNPISLLVQGTDFQVRVWRALCAITSGDTISYGDLARRINMPTSARALGNAAASNDIAWLIPCHRLVPKHARGAGNYRWGVSRKQQMLLAEQQGLKGIFG